MTLPMIRYFGVTFLLSIIAGLKAQKPQQYVVYFPFNQYYISNAAAETLDKAIKENEGRIIDSVKIYAYCDSIGSLPANDTLAINRTLSVKTLNTETLWAK